VPLNIAQCPERLFPGRRIVVFPQKPQALDAVLVYQAVHPFHYVIWLCFHAGQKIAL
jgi:hypothetical protein